MKKSKLYSIIFLATSLFTLNACKDDKTEDPTPTNPGELITTVRILFENPFSGVVEDSVEFNDPDGAGGVAPTQDSIILSSNMTYLTTVILLDETKTPVDTISNEVDDESDVHKFVFTATPASGFLTTDILDTDVNGNDVGLNSSLQTGNAAKGSYRVQLRHYNSAADKTANSSTYDTDIDVTFGVRIN